MLSSSTEKTQIHNDADLSNTVEGARFLPIKQPTRRLIAKCIPPIVHKLKVWFNLCLLMTKVTVWAFGSAVLVSLVSVFLALAMAGLIVATASLITTCLALDGTMYSVVELRTILGIVLDSRTYTPQFQIQTLGIAGLMMVLGVHMALLVAPVCRMMLMSGTVFFKGLDLDAETRRSTEAKELALAKDAMEKLTAANMEVELQLIKERARCNALETMTSEFVAQIERQEKELVRHQKLQDELLETIRLGKNEPSQNQDF